jgi:hypothetical protein
MKKCCSNSAKQTGCSSLVCSLSCKQCQARERSCSACVHTHSLQCAVLPCVASLCSLQLLLFSLQCLLVYKINRLGRLCVYASLRQSPLSPLISFSSHFRSPLSFLFLRRSFKQLIVHRSFRFRQGQMLDPPHA